LLLTAVARDASGAVIPGMVATWSSSNPAVATISATGVLQGVAVGSVQIATTIDGMSATRMVTVTPMPRIGVTVGTAKEVVFDYTADRCADLVLPGKPPLLDIPDQPARFVRAEDGSLVLFDGLYLSRGKDFASLKRDCSWPPLGVAFLPTPESYENMEILWSVYREGSRWHGLIHNEFHDAVASTCRPGDPTPSNPCWYNSITYAVSTDGARSFSKPSPPAHVVAPTPQAWVPPKAPASYYYVEGYMSPTNIVRGDDGYYYAMTTRFPDAPSSESAGLCVIRTDNLGEPAGWRAWDGGGFNLRMTSPYVTGRTASPCKFLKTDMASGHLVYNTYWGRYIQVAQWEKWIEGRYVCGIFYALSADLIHWSEQQLLAEVKVWNGCSTDPQGPGVLEPVQVGYSSIVDHADATINFERTGRTAYLYYTRFNDGGLDRDVVRVPLTFTRLD
jgi:hypothetical protein